MNELLAALWNKVPAFDQKLLEDAEKQDEFCRKENLFLARVEAEIGVIKAVYKGKVPTREVVISYYDGERYIDRYDHGARVGMFGLRSGPYDWKRWLDGGELLSDGDYLPVQWRLDN